MIHNDITNQRPLTKEEYDVRYGEVKPEITFLDRLSDSTYIKVHVMVLTPFIILMVITVLITKFITNRLED